MITALAIVNAAAEEVGVKTAETALESSDFEFIFSRMNDMLFEWADAGLTPQFIEVFNSDDIVNIPDSGRAAVKYSLAARIAPSFQYLLTLDQSRLISEIMSRFEASVSHIGAVAYPDSLPIGSGNECFDTDQRFFPNNKDENF